MAAGGEAGKPAANRSCDFCIRAIKYLPVVFLSIVIGWSYYAYTIQLCFRTVTSNVERVCYLVGYHLSLFIFLWSYWQTIVTESGKVPSQFRLPYSELEKLDAAKNEQMQRQVLEKYAANLPIYNRTVTGAIRFCEKCRLIKPDRAHHCSVCGICVLKMDHHCPWVNNCVSFTNYKFFILFLGYALLYCLFVTFTSMQYCIKFWKGEIRGMGRFNIVFLFFAALMFAVSLFSLFCYHCYLVMHNRTTLEAFRAPLFVGGADKDGFSLGAYNNFQEVFGDNRRTWFFPVFTSLGDGISYPVRSQHQANYNSMGNTENSLGDGVTYPHKSLDEDCHHLLSTHRWEDDNDFETASLTSEVRSRLAEVVSQETDSVEQRRVRKNTSVKKLNIFYWILVIVLIYLYRFRLHNNRGET